MTGAIDPLDGHWITIGWFVGGSSVVGGRRIRPITDQLRSALVLTVAHCCWIRRLQYRQLMFNMHGGTMPLPLRSWGFVAYGASSAKMKSRTVGAIAVVAMNAHSSAGPQPRDLDYYSRQIAAVQPGSGNWRAQGGRKCTPSNTRDFTYSALFMACGAMLIAVGFWRSRLSCAGGRCTIAATIIIKVFTIPTPLDRVYRILSFLSCSACCC